MLEAKSEFRVQIGALVNPATYIVMPRTALGLRLALNLLKLKSVSEKTIDSHGKSQNRKGNLTISVLKPEADLFREVKIMPIAMQQGTVLWCYPLPLIEEYRPTNRFPGKTMLTINTGKEEEKYREITINQPEPADKRYDRSFNLTEIEKIPLAIEIDESLSINKYRIRESKLNNEQITQLVEKLSLVKNRLIQQERDSLHKKCQIQLVCYYDNHLYDNGINKYQLKRIEIRRIATLHHLTATIPLAIISLANNKSISYHELLGEVSFSYLSPEDNTPSDIKFNLHILY